MLVGPGVNIKNKTKKNIIEQLNTNIDFIERIANYLM